MTFSSNAINHIFLNRYNDKQSLINHIRTIHYQSGGTNTAVGLQMVLDEGFVQSHGDRRTARNILIILTDGKSNNPAQTAMTAQKVHMSGIETIAVGVGSGIGVKELITLASDAGHVFQVVNFDALHTLQAELKNATCNGRLPPLSYLRRQGKRFQKLKR